MSRIVCCIVIVSDAEGDRVVCRWAEGREECGAICGSITNFTLDSSACTVHLAPSIPHGLYALAIQIEDFVWGNEDYGSLSSIPLQFIIQVREIFLKNQHL